VTVLYVMYLLSVSTHSINMYTKEVKATYLYASRFELARLY
jgi:hypothetical protein